MTDEQLLHQFESGTVSADDFDHETHVRVTWLILRDKPVLGALATIVRGLEQLTARLGVPGKYHQTITVAYVLIIHERLERTGRDASWTEFAAANPDLMTRNKAALMRYYSPEELDSELARRVFVLPAGDLAARMASSSA